ncbi:MAG TPA: SHOCT domain-containing protein, partial [Dielma fastidiosa]|nr:SHOCT domain-containing protein [Dielma fastidiosa]
FQTVQNLLSAFAIILEDNAKSSDLISDSKGEFVRNDDPTEQLRKYKSLLDDGIITQEEFDSKKKQILGL